MAPGRFASIPSVAALVLAVSGCLGTGTRSVDASCREMRGSVAREMLRDSREIPLLDVRSAPARKVSGAVAIPLSALPGRLAELDRYRATPVIIVGETGEEGQKACEVLSGAGFKHAIYVSEGLRGILAGSRGGLDTPLDPMEKR